MTNYEFSELCRRITAQHVDVWRFVSTKHHGQRRKNGNDYVTHLLNVAALANHATAVIGCHIETIRVVTLVGLLHDIIEDTSTTYDQVAAVAGDHVAKCVARLTDDKRLPKAERRLAYLSALRGSRHPLKLIEFESVAVKIADVLHNATELCFTVGVVPPLADEFRHEALDKSSIDKIWALDWTLWAREMLTAIGDYGTVNKDARLTEFWEQASATVDLAHAKLQGSQMVNVDPINNW